MSQSPRVLVTGGDGQLGRAIARRCPSATVLTRAECDVTDTEGVLEAFLEHAPDVVVHAAAWTHVDRAETDPTSAASVNVEGTRNIAEACERLGSLLVYPSTDYVFSGESTRPYTEGDTPDPQSVYGRTKYAGEKLAGEVSRHLVVRTSWVFGDGKNFVNTMLRLGSQLDKLEVVQDQIGRPTYAMDLAEGMLVLAFQDSTGTFHVSGGGPACSWADFARALFGFAVELDLLDEQPAVVGITSAQFAAKCEAAPAPRPEYSVLDCSKATSRGVELRDWRAGLQDYLATLKKEDFE